MKKFLWLILCYLIAPVTYADDESERWEYLTQTHDDSSIWLIDTRTLSSNSAWIRTEFKRPQILPFQSTRKIYYSISTLYNIKCQKKELSINSQYFYSKKKNLIYSFNIPEEEQQFHTAAPDTINESIINRVCQQ